MKKDPVLYIKSSTKMLEIIDNSVDLIITSPPYFCIKDYWMNGTQDKNHSQKVKKDIGSYKKFDDYLKNLLKVWKECHRVLKPNGKLCINVPLLPMIKKLYPTNNNRHIFDLQSQIQNSILNNTEFKLLDIYIWNRNNSSKSLMFGSYPYPGNFYAQNTSEFIAIYVKNGKRNFPEKVIKTDSKLTKDEWINYTKQVWNIPSPGRGDSAFGEHPAIMPEEIPKRLIKMFSFIGEVVLDPFAGSGTTMKMAQKLNRHSLGYEIYEHYANLVKKKVNNLNVKK